MRFIIEDVKHTTMAFVGFCSLSDLYRLEIPLKQKIWSSSVDIWPQQILEQWFQPGNWGNSRWTSETKHKRGCKVILSFRFVKTLATTTTNISQQLTIWRKGFSKMAELVVAGNSASSKPTESAVSFRIFAEFIAILLYITINQHLAWWADLNSETACKMETTSSSHGAMSKILLDMCRNCKALPKNSYHTWRPPTCEWM